MAHDLQQYQQSLAQLLKAGTFVFDDDLSTLTEEEYQQILNQVEPQNYEVAYEMNTGLNILEKLVIERDDQGLVDAMTYQRTWRELGMRVFEYEITTPAKLIVIGAQDPDPGRTIRLSWWCLSDGTVAHYRAMYDNLVLFSEGILK